MAAAGGPWPGAPKEEPISAPANSDISDEDMIDILRVQRELGYEVLLPLISEPAAAAPPPRRHPLTLLVLLNRCHRTWKSCTPSSAQKMSGALS
eukprot:9469881-Pyramimonas_sp.AAC.1